MLFKQEAIKDKDLHGGEEQKQIAKPNFNPQIPHPDDGVVDSDNQEGAADGAGGNHDNRIENQGPVNLQVINNATDKLNLQQAKFHGI